MVSFISGDVGLAPAFKEPEESMSTSPQATILAMEQQQSRAEVRGCSGTLSEAPNDNFTINLDSRHKGK